MREPQTLFGERLRAARQRAELSQKELGIRIGMDPSVASARMNQYEVGSHSPKFDTARHIARELSVPTAYFYAEEQVLADMIVAFGRLTKTRRAEVVAYVQISD